MTIRGAGEKIEKTVSAWGGVEAHPHRFGGTEFRIGKREIGHIHGDTLVGIGDQVEQIQISLTIWMLSG